MKKFLNIFTAVLLALVIATTFSYAALTLFPERNHAGTVGKTDRVFSTGYFDYLYLAGNTAYKFLITGTPTAARTVTVPDDSFTISGLKYYFKGTSTSDTPTQKSTSGFLYSGSVAFASDTTKTVTGFSPAFTSTSTYNCIVAMGTPTSDATAPPVTCTKTSTSSVTFNTATAKTATIPYLLIGY